MLCDLRMKHFYTYGTKESDLNAIKSDLSSLFGVTFSEHESGWWGLYALSSSPSIKEIKIYPNFVEGEGYHEEDEGLHYLLSISCPEHPDQIPELVKQSKFDFKVVRHHAL